jgi:hypothetical protein|tara:strand:+ start:20211 stop:20333 length:123 start_codon:yes stop_codon:yes gene_type:complete
MFVAKILRELPMAKMKNNLFLGDVMLKAKRKAYRLYELKA